MNRTYKRILQQHHWKGMRQMIKTYILSCETCQRQKIPNRSVKNQWLLPQPFPDPLRKSSWIL